MIKKTRKKLAKSLQAANITFFIVGILGILIIVNFFATKLFLRIDLTQDKIYSLNQPSIDVISDLPGLVTAKVFFTQDIPQLQFLNTYLQDMLEEYRAHSNGNFEYAIIDPALSPETKQEAINLGIRPNQLQVRTSEGVSMRDIYLGIALFYEDKNEVLPKVLDTKFEYDVTTTIKKLISTTQPKIYFTNANGEYTASSGYGLAVQELQKLYDVAEINLETDGANLMPNEIVVVGSPKTPLSNEAKYYLDQHLVKGGKVFLAVEGLVGGENPSIADHGFTEWLAAYGVKARTGLVIDQVSNFAQAVNIIFSKPTPWIPAIQGGGDHPIVKDIPKFYVPFATPLSIDPTGHEALEYTTLAQTSQESWAETDPNQLLSGQIQQDPSVDILGPIQVALSITGKFTSQYNDVSRPSIASGDHAESTGEEGRLIVLGSGQMMHDESLATQRGNINFILNSLDWLSLEESLIQIRSSSSSSKISSASASRGIGEVISGTGAFPTLNQASRR